MAGAYYIWIMAAFFVVTAGVIGLFVGLLYFGHWLDRRSGAKHGFLELPREYRTDEKESRGTAEGGSEQQA
ncbi:MAG TPA: hypothetical protein VH253_04920 [Phycisphaerae bacterium]|nr:hypothetical protein [Phycisphaerae bacterium]